MGLLPEEYEFFPELDQNVLLKVPYFKRLDFWSLFRSTINFS